MKAKICENKQVERHQSKEWKKYKKKCLREIIFLNYNVKCKQCEQ